MRCGQGVRAGFVGQVKSLAERGIVLLLFWGRGKRVVANQSFLICYLLFVICYLLKRGIVRFLFLGMEKGVVANQSFLNC